MADPTTHPRDAEDRTREATACRHRLVTGWANADGSNARWFCDDCDQAFAPLMQAR